MPTSRLRDQMLRIEGSFQNARAAKAYHAFAVLEDGRIEVFDADTDQRLHEAASDQYLSGSIIPGLAVDLNFSDGAVFTPLDTGFRWPHQNRRQRLAAKLETNRFSILLAIVLSPILLWWLLAHGIPSLASASVVLVPDDVSKQMGQQTFVALRETALAPSQLPPDTQQTIRDNWNSALSQLTLTHQHYSLHFFHSDLFGANAFALPDGTVIITDDLVNLLSNQPDAILAILLHEIGHVEHQHSLRLVAQSLGSAMVFGLVFGDLETVSELLLGAGSNLLHNAFSRDMEREADDFAITHLQTLGKPASSFADAMSALIENTDLNEEDASPLLKYLSTHPETSERIGRALTQEK
ncbi:M48 family metallopeptidase [Nitrincola sp. MINF-07-Sa-05]|uniref:M48 family metallopeptidase n=1 Tax=Nitrincola salilacus TaxID=3400273 RepID=UPI0039185B3D